MVKEFANRTGKYKVYGNIVVVWLISAIFTCSGNNAKHISQAGSQNHFEFFSALKCFGGLLKQIDWSYIILGFVCLLGAFLTYTKHRNSDIASLYKNKGMICVGTGILTTTALLLISAVSMADFGKFFGHTLYAHKLIGRPIIIKVKIDTNMNKEFYKQDGVINRKNEVSNNE